MKIIWLVLFFGTLLWSGIDPKDQLTWLLEVLPALLGLAILVLTYRSFPLSGLAYMLILLHCIILMIGGHYTYAEVPLFDDLSDFMGWERNNYDKVGHFAQGFIPAIITREVLIRKNVVNGAFWRNLFVISFCLAFSAFYELIEWWVALLSDEAAEAFLGTQGYVWDTQSDMFLALIGACAALFTLGKIHDRALAKLARRHDRL